MSAERYMEKARICRSESSWEVSYCRTHVHSLFEERIHKPWGIKKWTPPADVFESPEGFIVKLDLPGVAEEHIYVQLKGTMLTIEGERDLQADTEGNFIHRLERPEGVFRREFEFTDQAVELAGRAYKHGVLMITLKKVNAGEADNG